MINTHDTPITILCYGDSNTYGFDPVTGMRFAGNVRWTGRLQHFLGEDYRVIEEGCNGRTTVFDDHFEGWKSGLPYLKPCLNSHKPIDIVIMMLGTNDLKRCFKASAGQIASGARTLVEEIQTFTKEKQGFVPKIILVSPPEIGENITDGPFRHSFDATAITRSKAFPENYRKVAEETGCIFFDAAKVVKPSEEDCLHLNAREHGKLARALVECICFISP